MEADLLLRADLDRFYEEILAEYKRVTWRTTWACAAIAAVMNILLVAALLLTR